MCYLWDYIIQHFLVISRYIYKKVIIVYTTAINIEIM